MSVDLQDEILQDFMVEAGEILEQLNEELVDLEQSPDDRNLLNGIFRGFHTIKGGASFLSLNNLVDLCHKSEDVFNLLRNGELKLNSQMMDCFLTVLDEVNRMFAEIQSGVEPEAASIELIQALVDMLNPEVTAKPVEESEPEATVVAEPEIEHETEIKGDDEISDEEFEALLDSLDTQKAFPGKPAGAVAKSDTANSDARTDALINDDEFEDLLDQLHGKNQGPSTGADVVAGSERVSKTGRKTESKLKESEAKQPISVANGSKASAATVRVDTTRLDEIMNLVGELVLARNRLNTLKQTFQDEQVHKAIANLDMVTGDLQSAIMKTRMQPIKKVFGRFPRVVRDLARSLGKEIELKMRGEETDLDKNLVEALADPLIHLVRNSVDHGIESPEDRMASGKPSSGTVELSASQAGDCILLTISDDGAGIDPEKLRAKAVESGLMDADSAARLDEKGCFDLIFMPGLTTKQEISNVSGRGVGMDVVKTKITQLNGTIEIESEIGKGTVLKIKVPLTLAILPTLMIQVGSQKFALPLSTVSEIFDLSSKRTNMVDGCEVVLNRGLAPPIFRLRKWLLNGSEATEPASPDPQVIMTQVANTVAGFVVDQVIGQEEVVIKPLGAMLQGLPGLAGSTITGDGSIAIILDVQGLLKQHLQ